ncbi:DEAD/DEAH box helicase domain protein [Methanocaldococcus infernus ME]|uniref:DEAD/DEAH box helicase domain protein n=1 Tax=Methanocaldococcus infernus (strain DSM 11812 / JCM 15783 / ME) TaxID=573063 RepID=D5VQR7_METIM|nr:DEAD/DEAH box helicase [Methanocaldococcus infernus]ADG12920.1 DEAD/DEAH box helicase domain protein [Methanocaldococcus infernus ME]
MIKEFKEYIIYSKEIPKREGVFGEFNFKNKEVNALLEKLNFKLYKHQVEALKALYEGRDILLTTPTASGKSEVFRLSILDNFLSEREDKYLLIFPTRALIYNQYEKFKYIIEKFKELINEGLKIEVLTGDTSYSKRLKILEEKPEILIVTPDMLHFQILRFRERYRWLLDNLRYLVVDEIHEYNGVFGANVSYVFKRLLSLTEPQIIALSATLKDPKSFTKTLFERDFEVISKAYNPSPKKYFLVFYSENIDEKDLLGKILSYLISKNIKTLTFFDSRRKTEEILKFLLSRGLKKIITYRGTFTHEDRREIERKFKEGEYLVLLTTNALELGIDIGDVDTVINYGIPSTGIFSLIQRFGRAGRRDREAINAIILRKDGLDIYYKENVEELSEKVVKGIIEDLPITKENRLIAKKHILLMIKEHGYISIDKFNDFEKSILKELSIEGKVKLVRIKDKLYVTTLEDVKYNSLRNIRDDSYYLVNGFVDEKIKDYDEKEILSYIDKLKEEKKLVEVLPIEEFYSSLLPGMVYYSRGEAYLILDVVSNKHYHFLSSLKLNINVKCSPLSEEEVSILKVNDEKEFKGIKICRGRLKIVNTISKFIVDGEVEKYLNLIEKLKNSNYFKDLEVEYLKRLGKVVVSFPKREHIFETEGIYLIFPNSIKQIPKREFDIFFSQLDDDYKEVAIELYSEINRRSLYNLFLGATSHYIRNRIKKALYSKRLKASDEIVYKIFNIIESKDGVISGLHAIEHLFIKLSPIFAFVNSKELGGRSYSSYPKAPYLGKSIIFIYDANEGGSGLSELLYKYSETLIKKVYKHLNICNCYYGCPKCILSTKCGNFNEFLSKWQAIEILKQLLEGEG